MLLSFFKSAIGFDVFTITSLMHMCIRGVIVYFFGITLVRCNKKLFSIHTPFNFILFVILGSILSEAIVDEKDFISIIFTITLLIVLNHLIALSIYRIPILELLIKGKPTILVNHGEIKWKTMEKHRITKSELLHELHIHLNTNNLEIVELAYITTEGRINFVKKN